MAQQEKNLPVIQDTRVRPLGQEGSLEQEMATGSSILVWKISWIKEHSRLRSKEVANSWTWLWRKQHSDGLEVRVWLWNEVRVSWFMSWHHCLPAVWSHNIYWKFVDFDLFISKMQIRTWRLLERGGGGMLWRVNQITLGVSSGRTEFCFFFIVLHASWIS